MGTGRNKWEECVVEDLLRLGLIKLVAE